MITRSVTRPVTRPLARAITDPLGAGLTFSALTAALFRNGEAGVAYDTNDLSTLFQDSAGTTPVTAAGQPVGLQLDKSRGLVLGAELAANGTFNDNVSGWVNNGGGSFVWVAGKGRFTRSASTDSASQGIPTTAGKWYEIKSTASVVSGATGRIAAGPVNSITSGSNVMIPSAVGSVTLRFLASAATSYILLGASADGSVVDYDNVSVRELPGNHRFQTAAASRPTLRQNATTGAYYLEYDGVDDFLVTNAIDFTATDKVSVFVGVRKLSDASAVFVELSIDSASTNRTFSLLAPSLSGANSYRFTSRGTSPSYAGTGNFAPAPNSSVVSAFGNIAADIAELRINGLTVEVQGLDQGTGNYSLNPLYFGRRAGTSLPFNGHEYSTIIVGRLTNPTETRSVKRLLAKRVGVQLA